MKKILLYLLLSICFKTNAQRILVPQEFIASVLSDSLTVLGHMEQHMEVQLKYDSKTFYHVQILTASSYLKVKHIQDSLFLHAPETAKYWKEEKQLPPGTFCISVLNKGKNVVSRCNTIERQSPKMEIVYQLDSFTLKPSLFSEGDLLHIGIYKILSQGPVVHDTTSHQSGKSYEYTLFKKNVPYVLRYQILHKSGIAMSDTIEQRFVPNTTFSRDSVRKIVKAKRQLLKKEMMAADLAQLDSLKSPLLPKRLLKPPNGTLSFSRGTFQGQNPGFSTNDFFQVRAHGNISLLGLPVIAQAYFFDNGINAQNRRDFKLSFDYQRMLTELEAKKNALEGFNVDSLKTDKINGLNTELRRQLPDTVAYAHFLNAKLDSLKEANVLEQQLDDSIDKFKKHLKDSPFSDSLTNKYNDSITTIEDSINQIRIHAAQIRNRIESLQELKKKYAAANPLDSVVTARKQFLEKSAVDSFRQYAGIDKYLLEKGHLNKGEEEYRKAQALYKKLQHLRSFDIGVITPSQSPFSLSGVPLKGISTSYDFNGQNLSFTGGKMIPSPFFLQPLFNVLTLSNEFDVLEIVSIKVASSNFWQQQDYQSISEISLSSSEWKGWKVKAHLANSINKNHFDDHLTPPPIVNKGNTSIVSRLSKAFGSGLQNIEAEYKYVPASYQSPGNPFLINDREAGTLRFSNSLFKRSLTSLIEFELNRNNTLDLLPETTQGVNLFSFQQLDISGSFQVSTLSSYLLANGPVQQSFRMHDINCSYACTLGRSMLSASTGFMYQNFSNDGLLNNQTSLLKATVSLVKDVNRFALSFYQSAPIRNGPSFSTCTGSFKKRLFKGKLQSELRGGFNNVAHMSPRITYGYLLSVQLYKNTHLSVNYQGNSILIDANNFYAASSMGVVKLTSSF